jgi:aspartyl-tRNA(Asn)/glutamyl-tRNA(Gln) amidotransferase subunit B
MSTEAQFTHPSGFEAVIGIEVHVQLNTLSKIFCADANHFEAGDNENVSPISLGMPGTLPVLNRNVLTKAIKAGLALNCHIRSPSYFARKNYFYPDLPKGYQISQFDKPICENGYVEFSYLGEPKKISITRAHLEEDAGKSSHFPGYTLLNYNRAGVPLLEIVSGPDIRSAGEAAEYCKVIRSIVQYIDICDGNLEEGSLRCDCNVSVRPKGAKEFGTRVELKNLNSYRFIEKAIDFEIERQIDQIQSGKNIVQETRLYDPDKNKTFTMRTKEDAQDYRYFVDPDLLPIYISKEEIEYHKKLIPELPLVKAKRYMADYKLTEAEAMTLTADKNLADYFEKTYEICQDAKAVANWLLGEFLRSLNTKNITIQKSLVSPENLAELILAVQAKIISLKIAKTVFTEMSESGDRPKNIIEKNGYINVSDPALLEKTIGDILNQFPDQVKEFKSGKTKVLGFLVGAIMKATQGQADTNTVNEILKQKLDEIIS